MNESSPTLHNFVPNQIMFVLEQPNSSADVNPEIIEAFLRRTLQTIAKGDEHAAYHFRQFRFDKLTPFSPPEINRDGTALNVVQAGLPDLKDADLMRGIYAIFQARHEEGYLAVDDTTGLRLLAITPNWLMAGAPNEPPAPPDSGAGGGGPGGKPIPPQAPLIQFNTPWDVDSPCNFHLSAAQPQTQPPIAMNQLQLEEIAALFNIPISNPAIPDDIRTMSDMSYSMLNHTLQTRLQPRPPAPKMVKVVILDTAPPCEPPAKSARPVPLSLIEAYKQWGASGDNPLLRSLLQRQSGDAVVHKANGSKGFESDTLTITYYEPFDEDGDPYDGVSWDLKRACQIAHNRRDWVMDHGLFIAGIIHTLAPKVKIHLIEVLNAYGCGTLATYLDGLAVALSRDHFDPKTETLVVNMSFTFPIALDPNHPTEWLQEFDRDLQKQGRAEDGWGRDMQAFLNYLTLPMQYVLQGIASVGGVAAQGSIAGVLDMFNRTQEINYHGGVVVAAAGNNGTSNAPHPAACAPAAFSTVLGVAALNANNQSLTDYSNNADIPPYAGLAVFGGENQTSNHDLAHSTKGILGLYIGAYPAPTIAPNTTGWARWSGTSFAAPIISGILAEMLRQGWTVDQSVAMIRFAFGESNGLADRLKLRQGPSVRLYRPKGCVQALQELWSNIWQSH